MGTSSCTLQGFHEGIEIGNLAHRTVICPRHPDVRFARLDKAKCLLVGRTNLFRVRTDIVVYTYLNDLPAVSRTQIPALVFLSLNT